MKTLAIDWGTKRLGLALSDPKGALAFPHSTLDGTKPRSAIEQIRDLVRSEAVRAVVVGLPLNVDGTEGRSARRSTAFAERLARAIDAPVTRWDERYTTEDALRLLREAGRSPAERRAVVDQVSAAVLLQSYLDARGAAHAG